jgi:hypothetical protein
VLWLLCAPLCRAQPALTTISDTLYDIDGSLMDGNIIVTNAAFSVGGVPIARGARAFPITSGVVNIQLTPTDHASPAIVYTVNTVSNGQTSTNIWSVPTLPSSRCPSGTCTIVQVTTLYTPGPTTTVALSQLSTQGATNGQMICDTAGVAVWCNPPAGGVTSFDGRSGAISPAANDYNFNQLAGAASVGQLPTGIPASNIGGGGVGNTAFGYVANLTSDAQAQLNAKLTAASNLSDVGSPATALSNLGGLPKGTVITWIDQYCSVPGTYDDTCFSHAFSAAGSTPNVTFMMGPNTYALQNGLSISSTTGWTIMGLKARSKLTVKNGLNTAMLTLNSTTDFAMRDVFADGNYTNQTSETSVISATGIIGLILEGNRFANVKGRAVVVSNSAYDFTDGLFIVGNIISGTTDSALYLALRYDGLTITGNRIDGIGIDGSNPQKAAAIYVTHGSTSGGLQMVGYSGNYIMASPNVNGNTYLQYGILFDAINGPPVNDLSNSYTNVGTNCGSINNAVNCVAAMPSVVNGNPTQIFPVGYCSAVGATPIPSPQFMGSSAAMQCISVGGTPMAAVPLAHGNGDIYASMLFETPVTYSSVNLSWAGYTDASGGNVDFIVLMACAPFSVSSGPSFPSMPGGSTVYSVTSGGGGGSISSSSVNEFTGPYGLGINGSCPNPLSGAVITRLYRRGSNGPDTNAGTLWIVWAKLEQSFTVH